MSSRTASERLRGRIPLVIGVTGHRDLPPADVDALKKQVAGVFNRIKRDYLQAGADDRLDDLETPVILLSALAEGADRLVAEVALEQGAILIAPLPMEEAEYREDFKPGTALAPDADSEFVRLSGRAFAKIELPYRPGSSREVVRADQDKRAEQYRDVGLYILSRCQVLIALWNGDRTDNKPGGTTENVIFKIDGVPMALSRSARDALDGSDTGPFIHVVTQRIKAGSRQVTIGTEPWGVELTGRSSTALRILRDAGSFLRNAAGRIAHENPDKQVRTWRVFGAIAQQTCRFNTDVSKLSRHQGDGPDPEQSLAWLFEDTKRQPIPDAQALAELSAPYWCSLYKLSDAVAQFRQRLFIRDWRVLFGAGFVAIVIFETFAHLLPDCAILLLIYAFVFGVAFSWFSFARAREHQERFLDYRTLAEALRVAVYWKLAGIRQAASNVATPVADAYPIKQPSELAWVKIVLRTLDMLHSITAPAPAPVAPGSLGMVRELWIAGQKAYFERQGNRHHRIAEMREAQSLILLALSPLIGVILLLMMRHPIDHHWQHWSIVAMGIVGGLAAVIAGYVEKLAHHAHARQYDRMRMLFEQALSLFDKALGQKPVSAAAVNDVERLCIVLGEEAMKENAEWAAIYRQRPIRPAG